MEQQDLELRIANLEKEFSKFKRYITLNNDDMEEKFNCLIKSVDRLMGIEEEDEEWIG